jgi:outer membrane immunogenic protein
MNTFSGIQSGFYGDVTGRLGYSFDPVLVYAKGGFAFFEGDAFVDNHLGACGPSAGFTSRAKTSGFAGSTIGGGLEYRYDPEWSVKVEYQHFDFGKRTATLHTTCGVEPYTNGLTADTVSVGVNIRLDDIL